MQINRVRSSGIFTFLRVRANFTLCAAHAKWSACLIHAGAAGYSVGRDIPGVTHGAHLRLVGDETSLFINVGRRGGTDEPAVQSACFVIITTSGGTASASATSLSRVCDARINRDLWIERIYLAGR